MHSITRQTPGFLYGTGAWHRMVALLTARVRLVGVLCLARALSSIASAFNR